MRFSFLNPSIAVVSINLYVSTLYHGDEPSCLLNNCEVGKEKFTKKPI
jgi:hypothetical protein